MILYAAKGRWTARRRFQPGHFAILTRALAGETVRWTDRLADLPQGGWALVIRAAGSYSLAKDLAARHAGGLFVFDAISREERRALDRKDGVLVVDLDWDPLLAHEEVVAGLIGSIERSGLDPARIRLVHANQAGRAPFEALWRKLSGGAPPRTLEFPTSFALSVAHHDGRHRPGEMAARLERARAALHGGKRSRLFTSLNGGLRASRLHLAAWLHHVRLLDRGHVSLMGYSKGAWLLKRMRRGSRTPPPAALRRSVDNMPYGDELGGSLEKVWADLPLTLDLNGDRGVGSYERMAWESADPAYYDDSWFSLVLEPHADQLDMLHITEKVAKPMLNAHPFLALGSPGALAQLRSYGFQTFAPQFDEAFDSWPWPRERHRRFLKAFLRLAQLAPDDLRQVCIELWPRCEHNYRHYLDGGARRSLSEAFQREVLEQLL